MCVWGGGGGKGVNVDRELTSQFGSVYIIGSGQVRDLLPPA